MTIYVSSVGDLEGTSGGGNYCGVKLYVSQAFTLKGVTRDSDDASLYCYLLDAGLGVIKSAAWASNAALFDDELTATNSYYLVGGSGGSTNYAYKGVTGQYPYNVNGIAHIVTGRIVSGDNSDQFCMMISFAYTQSTNATINVAAAQALALTLNAPTIQIDDVTTITSALAMTLSVQAPTIDIGETYTASAAQTLSLTLNSVSTISYTPSSIVVDTGGLGTFVTMGDHKTAAEEISTEDLTKDHLKQYRYVRTKEAF